MPKYNLYKIDNARRVEMVNGFEQKKMLKISSFPIAGYQVEFFLSHEQTEQDIWWVDIYSEFIPKESRAGLKNRSHFAALVAYDDAECFVVSLGKTFFYMRDYCIPDFGIDVAERIIDTKQIGMKNSRHFGGTRVKTIDTYRKAHLDYDVGEAVFFIKAETNDPKKWGKSVRCGTSIQFQLDIGPAQFIEKLGEFKTLLKEPPKFSLPRATSVSDPETIKKLNDQLVQAIIDSEFEGKTTVDVSSLSLFGTEFIFWGNQHLSLKFGHKAEAELTDGNEVIELITYLYNIGEPINLDTLDRLRILMETDTGRQLTYKVLKVIEYVAEDDDSYYFYSEGKWLRFSRNYVDSLKNSVDRIEWEKDLNGFKLSKIEDYKTANPEKKLAYREYVFNREKESEEGYYLGDRNLSYWDNLSVEIGDLVKEGTVWAVKMGKTRTFVDAIQQSIASLRIIQQNGGKYGECDVKELGIWLLSDNKNPINQLSDFRSLIF